MNVKVHIGKSDDYKLQSALLVYGQSSYNGFPYRHPFVTMHAVNHADGEPMLGPGKLVTPAALIDLVMGLGFKIPTEILPANVIVRGSDSIVWWSPARVRTMFFTEHNDDATMKTLNGKKYPVPALLFKVSGTQLWIRALAENKRPDTDGKVFMAPFWNCYANGTVCLGSSKIPRTKKVEQIYEWENSFFASEFSHAAGNTKSCAFPGGFLAMWLALQGKSAFPVEYLRPINQTLKQFVENSDGSYSNEVPEAE